MSALKRIEWIDLCKAVAICLVLLGHTLQNNISEVYIYGFHMPLFFMLSGLVLSDKEIAFKNLIRKKFNSLILPFIFFYLLTYIYWIAFERNFRSFDIEWWRPLLGLFYAGNWNNLMIHNGILWFLPCLFMVEMEYEVIKRLSSRVDIQLICIIILAIIGYNIKVVLPWCLNISFIVLQYYYIGVKLKPFLIKSSSPSLDTNKSKWIVITLFVVLFSSLYIWIQNKYEVRVNLVYNSISDIWLFQIISYLGTLAIIALSKIWKPYFSRRMWLFIGSNTLVIFALHQPILRVVRYVAEILVPHFTPETSVMHALLADIIILLILWPMIIVYNRHKHKLYYFFYN